MWTQVITGVIQTSLDPENKTGRIKAGPLSKVTKGNNYQQRWATVDSQSLKFFASEEDSSTLKDVESSIAIRDISEVVPVGPHDKSEFSLPNRGSSLDLVTRVFWAHDTLRDASFDAISLPCDVWPLLDQPSTCAHREVPPSFSLPFLFLPLPRPLLDLDLCVSLSVVSLISIVSLVSLARSLFATFSNHRRCRKAHTCRSWRASLCSSSRPRARARRRSGSTG